MRIALVTETWRPWIDGVVTRLVATVTELLRDGHEVMVIAPRSDNEETGEMPGVTVRTVPVVNVPFIYGGRSWGLPAPEVAHYLDEFEPDVVHVVNPVLLGMAGVTAARSRELPLVASYHTDVAAYATFYRLGMARPIIWRVLRLLHNNAELNVATSESACQQLRRNGVERVRLWRRGVDTGTYRPELRDPAVRERLGGDESTTLALYVGRIAEEKNLGQLAELAQSDGTRLVMVGEGPDQARLARVLSGAGAHFTGTLRGRELAEVYAAADVFVFPSTTDTLGLVLLEALASGLPIVAAESPASRELLGECPVARLYPTERPDLLPKLIADLASTGTRQQRAEMARSMTDRWSWASATEQLLGYYRQALAVCH